MWLFALAPAQIADERGELAVATAVTRRDLRKQDFGGASVLFGAMGVNLERLFECGVKLCKFARPLGPAVGGRRLLRRRAQPSAYCVAR